MINRLHPLELGTGEENMSNIWLGSESQFRFFFSKTISQIFTGSDRINLTL
ncbi:MAG: hypothetical protein V7L23_02785 [Nostoc sp.]|uniref:hypothetical protein n=1 Tax=Nostoc sp. TaxID=1180 RepID=UPI002FF05B92